MARVVYIVTHPVSARLLLKGQLRYLMEKGFDVLVISSAGKDLDRVAEREGIRTISVKMDRTIRPWRDVLALLRLYRTLRALQPDIVNASTPKAGLLGTLAAFVARVPVRIYTVRGLRLETARGLRRALLWCAERLASACAHRIVCVSQSLASLYTSLGLGSGDKILVLASGSSNGVDVERFGVPAGNSKKARLLERLRIPSDAPVIGFVGRLTKDKGIEEMLDAFDTVLGSCPKACLLLVGDFEVEDRPSSHVVHRIREHPRVVVTGFVPDPESYYSVMEVVAFPSRREGFPNVLLEAAASELPVVGFRGTGTTDAVRDGVTGTLVPMGESRAMAHALLRYLREPALRREHGKAGRRRAEEEFSSHMIWCALERALHAETPPRGVMTSLFKRLMDVVGAGVGLVVLAPIFVLTACAVYLSMGSPVLFRQKRPGLKGRPFDILKFRTMEAGSRSDDERLTMLGRFLRSTSLDEMPELWNVLRGDMSLVGPRPLLMKYLSLYKPEQARRHNIKPGITGWAQIHGRNSLAWEEKLEGDVWYVDHWSLWLDIRILWSTLFQVIRREGISAEGHATMPEFRGGVE